MSSSSILAFRLMRLDVISEGAIHIEAHGLHRGRTIRFAVDLEPEWDEQPIEDVDGAFYWGRGTFRSVGPESDALIAILDELYQTDLKPKALMLLSHTLSRIYRQLGTLDWNPYALVATIELAQGRDLAPNPEIPAWLQPDYSSAIENLGQLALEQFPDAENPELVRAILGVLALTKGTRTYGRILIEFTEDELVELEQQALGPGA